VHITILRKDIGDFHLWNADFRLTGMVISNGRTGDGFHSGILRYTHHVRFHDAASNFTNARVNCPYYLSFP